ncbi:MAG: glycine zipper 2TM domain-containing protein [Woeseiaceae bacterium]|nr:glycine zipper 2TM domain-containing protein [Woeseiaceae bacterium]
MKRQHVIGAVAGALAVTAIGAAAGVSVLNDEEKGLECRDVVVTVREEPKDPDRITGTVVGAVIGGVIGKEVGEGSGEDTATAVGAIAGGVAGNNLQRDMQEDNTREEVRRVCE